VPITEACEDALPPLRTHVATTLGPAAEGAAPPKLPAALPQRGLWPGTHSWDTGCLDAARLVESQDDDIDPGLAIMSCGLTFVVTHGGRGTPNH
jgi:hypothetical protein